MRQGLDHRVTPTLDAGAELPSVRQDRAVKHAVVCRDGYVHIGQQVHDLVVRRFKHLHRAVIQRVGRKQNLRVSGVCVRAVEDWCDAVRF